jgi:hypothetical protein
VLSGEALLVVEGEERPLRSRDFFHCHTGRSTSSSVRGGGPCVVLAVGSHEHQRGEDWGAYTVDESALRQGAGVREQTSDRARAYTEAPRPT